METNQTRTLTKLSKLLVSITLLLLTARGAYAQTDTSLSGSKAPQAISSAQKKESALALVIIVHVDVMPSFTASAVEQLKNYRKDCLKEGARRADVLQQVGRPNHFTVVEEWANQKAYDQHVSASHTRQFRAALQSMLGAPFDERPHTTLE